MKLTTKVTKDNVKEMLRSMTTLATRDVLVGVPETRAERDDDSNAAAVKGSLSNAALAYIHENGSVVANIPARPFLAPGIASQRDRLANLLSRAAQAALDAKQEDTEKALNAAGIAAQNAVRAKITQGPFQPLAARTLAARRRRGRTGTKPLIDTGQLRNSISYVIRNK